MAISVDTVYRTVLLILNKESRGYLTPDEYNKIGTQVQLEMFNEYFEDLNQQLRIPENDSEYSNRVKNLEEKLAVFKTPPAIANYNPGGYFNLPTPSAPSGQETITSAIGQNAYAFQVLQAAQVSAGTLEVFFDGVLQTENINYTISPGGGFINVLPSPTTVFVINVVLYENDFYKIGTVIYDDELEVERVNRNDFLYINMSPLTKPSTEYPVYIFEKNNLYIYPTTIKSDITASYLRKPISPVWSFTISGGYVYDPANSVDFELQSTEQTALVIRVLAYAGVVIRDPQIIQAAMNKIQEEKVNEKS
tara:strand:+ start:1720 stop:2640 length:921 start_codon:yes stop_codon:yes gene_type:complete